MLTHLHSDLRRLAGLCARLPHRGLYLRRIHLWASIKILCHRTPTQALVFFISPAVIGLLAFIATSIHLNQKEIWFSNLDQDSVLLLNALRINDGRPPTYFDHPSQGVYILYGGLFRVLNIVGLNPIGKFSDLEKHQDPIRLVPGLFYSGRGMSILISSLCVLMAVASIYVYTRRWEYAALGSAFLWASPGLLLQSLVIRSELTSVLFVCGSIFFLTLALRYPNRLLFFFLTGMTFGLAYITKIQVLPFAAWILFLAALALRQQVAGEDRFRLRKMAGFLLTLTVLGLICVLGLSIIRSFQLLLVCHSIYQKTKNVFPSTWMLTGLLLSALLGVCLHSALKNQSRFLKLRDLAMGIGCIGSSIPLIASPMLLTLFGKFRGRPPSVLLPVWQERIFLSLALMAVGVFVLRNKGQRALVLKQMRVAWILVAGFVFGTILSLVLCSADGETAFATNKTLFNYRSFFWYSVIRQWSLQQPGSMTSEALSVWSKVVMNHLGSFLRFYLFENYLLSGYLALLILTIGLQRVSRYLWPSLVILATGLLFMFFSSFRYYAEQYWIYSDFFFLGAWAFLAFGLIEQLETVWIRIASLALIGVLQLTGYVGVARVYPRYNYSYRDRIDKAAYAIHEVRDYSGLMQRRYGNNLQFIRRVLSDAYLNGSDRGIDLFAKSGVKSVIESTPELRAEFEAKIGRRYGTSLGVKSRISELAPPRGQDEVG